MACTVSDDLTATICSASAHIFAFEYGGVGVLREHTVLAGGFIWRRLDS
jgi:hypothetical protein